MKELTDEQKRNFIEWSEGNKYLYELLCTCWENDIKTFGSCSGHETDDSCPYVGIVINDKTLPYIKSILVEIQDMENISMGSYSRYSEDRLLPDDELRGLTLRSVNYNCCELFYKIKKGIEINNNEKQLLPEVKKFYDSLKKLNESSIEQLQEDEYYNYSEFSSTTDEYIEYENSNKLAKSNALIRFFRRILPFKKISSERYEQLQQKYGYLQREYREEPITGMNKYIIENNDVPKVQLNDKKRIKDVEPIEMGGVFLTKDTIQNFVEEPCLDACKYLYDLNINTIMSSANKKDVGQFGYINIELDSLSLENKQIALEILENSKDTVSLSTDHGGKPVKVLSIKTPINDSSTIGDVKKSFMQVISKFKMQDVLYGRYSYEELVQMLEKSFGENLVDIDLIKELGYCYCSDEYVYYKSEELLNKHLKYKNREKELEK